MIKLYLLLGGYGLLVFILGVLHLFHPLFLGIVTGMFVAGSIYLLRENIVQGIKQFTKEVTSDRKKFLPFLVLLLLALVNLIGALGPELAFDALWYHLTLPKYYLEQGGISYIPGGLLYYSGMPQLGEMYYVLALLIGNEITAKLIHFGFGILCCVVLYLFSRKFVSSFFSLLTVVVFYSNLVVAWESTTAYIDLIRTFFEFLSFTFLFSYLQTKERKYLFHSGISLGFAIGVKLLSLGSLILLPLLLLFALKEKIQERGRVIMYFGGVVFVTILPWMIYSFFSTGNPFFPLFTPFAEKIQSVLTLILPWNFIRDMYLLFLHSADPLSPLYLISLPLLLVVYRVFSKEEKLLLFAAIGYLILWYITPRTGGGRFILPYLPLFSLLVVLCIEKIKEKKVVFASMLFAVFLVSLITLFYRGIANKRYVPVILGKETKEQFLKQNLNFAYGDFYDTDTYFAQTIKDTDLVLLEGFHNLYYVAFPFVLAGKDDLTRITHIATQNTSLPKEYSNWKKIYHNKITKVTLYQKP